jgi:hypothetical protein
MKTCDFEMAVESTISFEKGWGSFYESEFKSSWTWA